MSSQRTIETNDAILSELINTDEILRKALENFGEYSESSEPSQQFSPALMLGLVACHAIDLNAREVAGTLTGHEKFANNASESLGFESSQVNRVRQENNSLAPERINDDTRQGYGLVSTFASTVLLASTIGKERVLKRVQSVLKQENNPNAIAYLETTFVNPIMEIGKEYGEDPSGVDCLEQWARYLFNKAAKGSNGSNANRLFDFSKGMFMALGDFKQIRSTLKRVKAEGSDL